jgi:inosose dehydratase
VRIGINPISWSNDDLPSLGGETPLETALSEGKAIGYEGFELGNKFPSDPKALAAVLGKHGLACVSGWYSGRLARGRTVDEEIEAVGPHLEKLVAQRVDRDGVRRGRRQHPGRAAAALPAAALLGEAQWREYGERLNRFGKYLLSKGVRLAYHHHMGAYVETPDDLDKLMSVTNDDVGPAVRHRPHDRSPAATRSRCSRSTSRACATCTARTCGPYVIRLARNRNWSFLEAVINGAFTVPATARSTSAAVLSILHDHGYRGWLVVEAEQDPSVAPSYAYAEKGYRALRGIVDRLRRKAA